MMKKIVFVGNKLFGVGGIEKITHLLAMELKNDYKIGFLTIDKSFKKEQKTNISTTYKTWFFKIKPQRIFQLFQYIKIYFTLIFYNPNIILLQSIYSNYFKFYFGLKKKIIFVDHGYIPFLLEYNIPNKNNIISNIFNISSKVIVLTSKLEKYLSVRFDSKKIVKIPNFIETNASEKNGFDPKSKTIVSCGRLCEQKNYTLLIEAFSIVVKNYPEWKLEIFGDGNEKDLLINKIKELNLENNVFLMGEYKSKDECYCNKAFYIMSSLVEGLPLVLIEAKSYNLPIISTDCYCGPSDIIRDNINGFLVENRNKAELAAKIMYLISDEGLRISMSQKSKLDVELFEKQNVLNKWDKIFKELKR